MGDGDGDWGGRSQEGVWVRTQEGVWVKSQEGVTVMFGVGVEGVTVTIFAVPTRYTSPSFLITPGGIGQSSLGCTVATLIMKSCQMVAGIQAPIFFIRKGT